MLIRPASVLVCLTLLLPGCSRPVEDDEVRFGRDTQALAEAGRLRRLVAEPEALSNDDFSALQSLHERYPTVRHIGDAYQAALIRRADWGALERYLRSLPAEALSATDRGNLIAAVFKQGKFEDVVVLAEAHIADSRDNARLRYMLAESYFNLDQANSASTLLDAQWQRIIAERSVDEVALRGRIYEAQGELPQAVQTLTMALQIDPDNKTALNALARLHYSQGDLERAEALRRRGSAAQAETSAQEQRALRSVYLTRTLAERWQQQRYEDVVSLANEALTLITDPKMRGVLYEYVVESHRRLGRADLADAALQRQRSEEQ